MQLNHYQTVFILTPVLAKDQVKDAIASFSQMLQKEGAQILEQACSEVQKLAYPIRKHNTGIYVTIEFKAPTTLVTKLEVAYKRDERVIRFLTTKLDKHGIAYYQKKRMGNADKVSSKTHEVNNQHVRDSDE